jgi:uncharacterized membrane protein YqjE
MHLPQIILKVKKFIKVVNLRMKIYNKASNAVLVLLLMILAISCRWKLEKRSRKCCLKEELHYFARVRINFTEQHVEIRRC